MASNSVSEKAFLGEAAEQALRPLEDIEKVIEALEQHANAQIKKSAAKQREAEGRSEQLSTQLTLAQDTAAQADGRALRAQKKADRMASQLEARRATRSRRTSLSPNVVSLAQTSGTDL